MNVVVLQGTLSREPEERELASGDRLVGYEVTIRPPEGRAESVPVVWPEAPASALQLAAGTDVVVMGRVRRRFFRAGGATQSRTEVVAEIVVARRSRRRVASSVERAVQQISNLAPG